MYQNQNNPNQQQNTGAQQNQQSNSRGNRTVVPEAKGALNQMKYEIASELGINLKQGYNGDLTSRQAGSVGGQMVKKMCPVHTSSFARENRTAVGHCVSVQYIAEWI